MFSIRDQKRGPSERQKLRAGYLNGIAIGLAVVGGFAPLVNAGVTGSLGLFVPLISLAGLGMSYYVHHLAYGLLKESDDERRHA